MVVYGRLTLSEPMAPRDSGQSRRWPGFWTITTVEFSWCGHLEAEDFRHLCNKWQWNPGSSLGINMPHVRRWLPSTNQPYIMTPIAASWPKWPCVMMRSAIFASFLSQCFRAVQVALVSNQPATMHSDRSWCMICFKKTNASAYTGIWFVNKISCISIYAKINAFILHYFTFKQKCVCN